MLKDLLEQSRVGNSDLLIMTRRKTNFVLEVLNIHSILIGKMFEASSFGDGHPLVLFHFIDYKVKYIKKSGFDKTLTFDEILSILQLHFIYFCDVSVFLFSLSLYIVLKYF